MPDKKPIVVVGSINMDLVASTPHIPAPGETILGSDFKMNPGGKGANQAVAAARLGHPVQMIGMLGSDDLAKQLRDGLFKAGVDITAIGTVPGPSGVAVIAVSDAGENSIVVIPGANSQLTPAHLTQHAGLIRNAGVVLAQLETPLETILHLADLCAQAKVPLILDPAPAQALPAELFAKVAWFTPNETEAAFYLQQKGKPASTEESAQALMRKGAKGIILKLGSKGAFLASSSGSEMRVPAFPVEAVDSTAAGDAFNGAFAAALMQGQSPLQSAIFASAAAAVSVTRKGAQASMANMEEVRQMLGEI